MQTIVSCAVGCVPRSQLNNAEASVVCEHFINGVLTVSLTSKLHVNARWKSQSRCSGEEEKEEKLCGFEYSVVTAKGMHTTHWEKKLKSPALPASKPITFA